MAGGGEMKEIREIKLDDFPFTPSAYSFGENEYPGISKHGDGYQIRIETSNFLRANSHKMSWDYFILDLTGLIIKSPRGLSGQYNRRVRIVDIKENIKEAQNEKI